MTLIKADIKAKMKLLLADIAAKNQEEDATPASVQDEYADELADWVIETIKTATITIPSGVIIVIAPDGVVSSNAQPIVIENGLK